MRDFVFLLFGLLVGFAHAGPNAGSKPNVLVLFADDLGYGDLSTYGHPTISTPNLDNFASQGMKFTQWYSGFHVCSPSRASLMTGRLPVRLGCEGDKWTGGVFTNIAVGGLPLTELTLPSMLKTVGYQTAAVGKWHLGQRPEYLPTARGFDHYFGIPYSVDMGSSAWNAESIDIALPLMANTTVLEQPTNLDLLSGRYAAFVDAFLSNASQSSDPFFLYMAFSHVHVPDFASTTFCNTSLRGLFGDAIQEMDALAGVILGSLDKYGLSNDTIVFFTSDNGPWLVKGLYGGSGGLLRDGKQTTWEGGIREPGIVRWPGKIAPGRNMKVVTTYDIYPTVLSLAGVPLPTDRYIDGQDLSNLLFADGPSPHDCLFHYKGAPGLACPPDHPDCPGLWAVRCGAYKMHFVTSSTAEGVNNGVFQNPPLLYNVEVDPSEAYPILSNTSEYQSLFTVIQNAIQQHNSTLVLVENEMAKGSNPLYAVCCPNPVKGYPPCTCNPENFKDFVCGNEGPPLDAFDFYTYKDESA